MLTDYIFLRSFLQKREREGKLFKVSLNNPYSILSLNAPIMSPNFNEIFFFDPFTKSCSY